MLAADRLTVVHHDDTRTEFHAVRYTLDRHGVRVATAHGEVTFTEVLTTFATRAAAPRPTSAQIPAAQPGSPERCGRCGCFHDYGCLTCSCTCDWADAESPCPCCGATDPPGVHQDAGSP